MDHQDGNRFSIPSVSELTEEDAEEPLIVMDLTRFAKLKESIEPSISKIESPGQNDAEQVNIQPLQPSYPIKKYVTPISTLLVHERQKKNPLMNHVNNVKWKTTKAIIPDFVFSDLGCIYFLSVRYHLQKPEYIANRIKGIPSKYTHRILLVLVDSDDHADALKELNIVCISNNMTLLLAWSNREAARYIETFKAYENKSPDIIRERPKESYKQIAVECLTTIRYISTTNANNLIKNYGTMKNILLTSPEQLSLIPGMGEKKIRRMIDVFNRPFVSTPYKQRSSTPYSRKDQNIKELVKRLDKEYNQ